MLYLLKKKKTKHPTICYGELLSTNYSSEIYHFWIVQGQILQQPENDITTTLKRCNFLQKLVKSQSHPPQCRISYKSPESGRGLRV